MKSPGSFVAALGLVLVLLFVGVAAQTFKRAWVYRNALKGERYIPAPMRRVEAEGETGDLVFFVSTAHPFHNSCINRTLFSHVGVIVRGRDLLAAGVARVPDVGTAPTYETAQVLPALMAGEARLGAEMPVDPAGVYVAETSIDYPLASSPGGRPTYRGGGSALVLFAPRAAGYGGQLYWARRAEGSRLTGKEREAVARRSAEAVGRPYPGLGALAFEALLGYRVTPHRHCYQHAAHVLNATAGMGSERGWPDGAAAAAVAMNAAAQGDDPRYERAQVLQFVSEGDGPSVFSGP